MTLKKELKSYGWVSSPMAIEELNKAYPNKMRVVIGSPKLFPPDLTHMIPVKIYNESEELVHSFEKKYGSIKEIEQDIEEKIGYFP